MAEWEAAPLADTPKWADAPVVSTPPATSRAASRALAEVGGPVVSGLMAGGEGLFKTLNQAAVGVGLITGMKPGGGFADVSEWFGKRREYWQDLMDKEGVGGVRRMVGEIIGGLPGGIAEWETKVPIAALAGVGEAVEKGEPEDALNAAIRRGGERYILGRVFKALGRVKSPVLRRGAGAATMAGTTAIHGGAPEEIAASGALGAVLTGKKRTIRKPAPTREEYVVPPDTSSAGAEAGPTFKPRVRVEGTVGRETIADVAAREEPPISTIPGEQPTISTRNVDTAAVRAEEGLPPFEQGRPRLSDTDLVSAQALWSEAAPPPAIVDQLAKEIVKKGSPHVLTDAEEQGFRQRIVDVRAQRDELITKAKSLPDGSMELQVNLDARKAFRTHLDELTQASKLAGRGWSQTGLSRQNPEARLLEDEISPSAMEAKAEEVKGGKLTPKETAEVHANSQKVKEQVERANARRQKVSERNANRAIYRGKSRYAKMTEVEKDAELAELYAKVREDPANADKTFYQMAVNLRSRPGVRNVGDVAARLQKDFDQINTYSLSDAIANATQKQVRETDLLREALAGLRREARTNVSLRTAIDDVLYHLREGTMPEPKRTLRTESEDITALRDTLAHYTQELRVSKPAQKARLERTLALLNAKIANKDYGPRGKVEKPLRDPELERLDYQIYQVRQELNQRIRSLDTFWTRLTREPGRTITQPLREIQEWKSSVDFSALARQGGIALRSHPIRTLRRLPEAIQAVFNPEKAWKIQNELINGQRAWYYNRVGLEFTDYAGGLNAREEAFAGNLIERAPGIGRLVRGSNRGFVTLLNMIRADSFNAMERSFAKAGGLALDESKALAYYVNVMTGRGSMAGLEKYTPVLNGALWSPRFTVSRIQYRLGMPIGKAPTWRTRRIIAQEYARYLAGVGTTMFLYANVFGGTVEQDNRSSDYGKIKIGNTRLDPLSGLSQVSVLLGRELRGETKTQRGKLMPLSGPGVPDRGDTRRTILERFVRSKLGYAPGLVWDILEGKDFTGEPISIGGEVMGAIVPLGFEDVFKLMQDQGVPKGLALETLNLFGEGVQTYEQKERGPVGGHRKQLRKRLR